MQYRLRKRRQLQREHDGLAVLQIVVHEESVTAMLKREGLLDGFVPGDRRRIAAAVERLLALLSITRE